MKIKSFITVVNQWDKLPDNLSCKLIWYKLPEGVVLHYSETQDLRWWLFMYWKYGFGEKARENHVQIVAIPAKVKCKDKLWRKSVQSILKDFSN